METQYLNPNKKIIYEKYNKKNANKKSTLARENPKIKIEMTMDQAQELLDKPESNRTIILPNGRKVGLTEAGDPNGTPVIMMSGMGMHSRKYALLLNNYGLRYKVKIIGFDRPNIDGSDPIYFKYSKKKSKESKKHNKKSVEKEIETCSHESDATLISEPLVEKTKKSNINDNTNNNTLDIYNSEKNDNNINTNNENNSNDNNNQVQQSNVKIKKGDIYNSEKNDNSINTNNESNSNDNNNQVQQSNVKVKKGEVDLKVYAEWVEAIIDALGIKRCHLMSLCIGGLYVLGCAKYFKHPEKIMSPLYLIAPWATPNRCVLPIRFVNAFVPRPVIRTAMACYYRTVGLMVPNARKHPNGLIFRLVHVDKKSDPLGGRRLLFSKILKSGFFRNETKRICHDDWELGFRVNPNNKLDFSTIEKDVIIYHGNKDKLIPSKSSKHLVKIWNPNYKAELHIKKGRDHSNIKGSCLHDIFRSIVENSDIIDNHHQNK